MDGNAAFATAAMRASGVMVSSALSPTSVLIAKPLASPLPLEGTMRRRIQRNNDLHGYVPDDRPVALLVVDVLTDFDFPDARQLLKKVPALAKNIAALKHRCRALRIPVIYANDNHGKWRSDAPGLINECLREDAPGRVLVEPLMPLPDDYIVLKPKHSAFYATPLDTLLSYLRA